MFRLGPSTSREDSVGRPLSARITSAGYAAMAYWYYRWDWGESIAIDGLLAAGTTLDNRTFTDFALREAQSWARAAGDAGEPDPMGPAAAMLSLLERGLVDTPEDAETDLMRFAERIVEHGDRLGALSPHGLDDSVFVDSLYGYPALLARLGRRAGRDDLVNAALTLSLRHCELLQHPDTGLFAHVERADGTARGTVAWGRGNGWAVLGLSDLLVATPPEHPRRPAVRARLEQALEGLRPLQEPGGWWRNVLDHPASYPEASTTAMVEAAVTQGIAARIVDTSYAEMADAAWHALRHRIDSNGHLVGVSYRPGVNEDPRRYEHTPAVGCYPWGQGAYLRSACGRFLTDDDGESAP